MILPKQSKPVFRFIGPVKNSGLKGVQASNNVKVRADRIQGRGGDFEDCDCICRDNPGADLGGPDGVFEITGISSNNNNNNNNVSL